MSPLRVLLAGERRRQRGRLAVAGGCAAGGAAATVLLLGLSGWFITSAALAGLGGAAGAAAFNYLLPSAAIRLLAITRTGCRYGERISGHDAALRALARVRPALFTALAAAPPATAMALSAGEAVARMTQDVNEVEAGFVRRSAWWGAGAAVLAGGAMVLPAGAVALGAVLASAALLVAAAYRLAVAQAATGAAVAAANGELKQDVAAMLAATQELRAYGLEDWAAGYADSRSRGLLAAQRRAASGAAWFEPVLAVAAGLGAMLALSLAVGAGQPAAAAAGLATLAMMEVLAGVLRGVARGGHLQAAERRLDAMLQTENSPAFECSAIVAGAPCIDLPRFGAHWPPGAIVGITGPSGCGKTTLLETLAGLRDGAPGQIRVGGHDVTALAPGLRRPLFSLAPQDCCLLAGSVRDNLLLGRPGANDAELWEALRDAALDRRAASLPGGLDCWIGEGGQRLSGGERRRLSLARALLRPAPWLLLDEPTEGLDAATEAVVVARLWTRLAARGQGAIIVSHRSAPLAKCDGTIAWDLAAVSLGVR